ncbi:MAG: pentapeptide repeat-containing protein [Chloroflexota bacterium]
MANLSRLRKLIVEKLNLNELETLAFDVSVNWDELAGKTLSTKAKSFLEHIDRRKGIPSMLEMLQETRPETNWLEITSDNTPSPYRGLRSFTAKEQHLFFGRESLTNALNEMAQNQGFVAVLGPSGSGKSSVVMAGLLPRLQQDDNWILATFRPGATPFHALAMVLLPHLYPQKTKVDLLGEETKLADKLKQGGVSLKQVIDLILLEQGAGTRFILFADQFEELYTLCPDRNLRRRFLDLLLATMPIDSGTPTNHLLTLTMRSDFLGQFLNEHAAFVDALQKGTVFMKPMIPGELREAIKFPALNLGVEFEPDLVNRILEDVANQPGQLPLLEFALDLLWERRVNNAITHETYGDIGRVQGALAKYATAEFAKLSKVEQVNARHIFLSLVQVGEGAEDTKRLAAKTEVGEERWPLVIKLANRRLLVTGQTDDGQETVEIAHEALIGNWLQLQKWINAEREFLTWLKQFRVAYNRWQESQNNGDLLRGTLLQQGGKWRKDKTAVLPSEEHEYLQTSLKTIQREQRDLVLAMIRRGEAVNADLSSSDLIGVDLSEADLSGSDLSDSNLSKANLSEAHIRQANLRQANLSEANLIYANLINANLSHANLRQADLTKAYLSWANLGQANLTEANLTEANLAEANLAEANLAEANLTEANLTEANLSEANLIDANLRQANLKQADLTRAYLRGVKLRQADLTEAHLDWADLSRADLSRADLSRAYLRGAHLREADLSRTDLKGADLGGADLRGADLRGADLINTRLESSFFNRATLWPHRFSPDKAGAILQQRYY